MAVTARARAAARSNAFSSRQAHAAAAELRDAIRRDELVIAYQPQIDLKTGSVSGAEALVRWQHPRRGMLGPAAFLSSAEETGAVVQVDDFVLRRACRDLATWRDLGAPGLRIAVNLSIRSLEDPALPRRVAEALSGGAIPAEQVEVEVTESATVHHAAMVVDALSTLRETGISVALDDFGTGYAMLDRLRSLPFDALKIDRSFVAGLETSSGPQLLVAALRLGQALGLRVVAEGVETDAQLDFLRQQRCDEVQGYLLGRPMASAELLTWLRSNGSAFGDTSGGDAPRPFGTDDAALERLVRPLLTELARLTELESTYLTYIDRLNGEQLVIYARNVGDLEIGEGLHVPWQDTVCKRSLETGVRYTRDVAAVFGDSPAGRALGLRTYAGVPVRGREGETWGTLCGASIEERSVGDATVTVMEAFSRLVSSQLELVQWHPPAQ